MKKFVYLCSALFGLALASCAGAGNQGEASATGEQSIFEKYERHARHIAPYVIMGNFFHVVGLFFVNRRDGNFADRIPFSMQNDEHIHFVFEAVALDVQKLSQKRIGKGAKPRLRVLKL